MTISRWTVSLTLFLLFLLFSALSTEVDWQNLAKNLLALFFGVTSLVIAIQDKRSSKESDVLWTFLAIAALIVAAQLMATAEQMGWVPGNLLRNIPPYVLLLIAPVFVAGFIDFINLISVRRGHGASKQEREVVEPSKSGQRKA